MRHFIIIAGLLCLTVKADEGMWVYTNLPKAHLKSAYGFEPTPEWTEHLMKSSVRFPQGSGSFISANGLVLTNHHVAMDYLHKISTASRNIAEDGFLATSQAAEIPITDLELNQLESIEDVTKQVEGSVRAGMTTDEATAARRSTIALIEKESKDQTKLLSQVVTLYQGGQYHLYRYKVYKDVRLVFAPEFRIAFFGGDPDNFEFPRYNLDMTVVRAYENGKPAAIKHYLKWSTEGAKADELVFVSGHPGKTNRLYTVDALRFMRDVRIKYVLDLLRRREIALLLYGSTGAEAKRHSQDELFAIQNSRKVYLGQLKGLQSNEIFAQKQSEELELRAQVAADENLRHLGDAWSEVSKAQKAHNKILVKRGLLEQMHAFNSQYFMMARTLVRLADEKQKPNGDRLFEYQDGGREVLESTLFSPAPIYEDLEVAKLSESLSLLAETYGYNHPLVQKVLNGKDPQTVAEQAVAGTKLGSVAIRKLLAGSSPAELRQSHDPFIQMALAVEKQARSVRAQYDAIVETELQAYSRISQALFAVKGTSVYPDATFTLRLAYGSVKGYRTGGADVAPMTTLGGAFDHEKAHGAVDPWLLPESWHKAKANLDLTVPFNFVSTADIIGGNSGSPVVNRDGELVGLIFDGNIQSLTSSYVYDDDVSRSVSVHSAGIMEVLKNVYHAADLVKELGQ